MNILRQKIAKYPVSSMYIVAIWILCFMDVPDTPLSNLTMIDKWTHIAMYLGTCLTIWLEYWRNHRNGWSAGTKRPNWYRLVLWAWLMPTLMSGVIEILQANCTGGRRSGEWLDFAANSIGTTLALVAGALWILHSFKHALDNNRA